MKTIFIFATLAMTLIAGNFEDCTAATKDMVDDVYEMVEDMKDKGTDVDADAFKKVLSGATEVAKTCCKSDVDLTKWDDCVDDLLPTLPLVGKLVTDLQNGDMNNLIADVLGVVNAVQQGVAACQNKSVSEYLF